MKTAIALWCIVAVGCKQSPVIQQSSGYATMTVYTSETTSSNNYSGSIRGKQDIDIYPQVSGFITKLCVAEGESVKKGQVLFIIDQVPYQAALNTAIANVEAAKASVATAQLTYDSKQELYKNKVVSEFDLKTAYNTLLSAKAQLAQAEAQEVNARNNLSYTEVKSPSNGVIGTLPYRVGALVSANLPKPLTTVSDNSEMYVYFSMTENQLLALTRQYGSKDKALENMPEIELQLNDKSLYPQTYDNCVVIPQAATFEIQDRVFVFKVVDGKTQSAPVEVTRVNGGQEYIVNAGLNSGDVIVAEGVGLLREGTPIEVKQN